MFGDGHQIGPLYSGIIHIRIVARGWTHHGWLMMHWKKALVHQKNRSPCGVQNSVSQVLFSTEAVFLRPAWAGVLRLCCSRTRSFIEYGVPKASIEAARRNGDPIHWHIAFSNNSTRFRSHDPMYRTIMSPIPRRIVVGVTSCYVVAGEPGL